MTPWGLVVAVLSSSGFSRAEEICPLSSPMKLTGTGTGTGTAKTDGPEPVWSCASLRFLVDLGSS